jgi:hypothetical protein
MGVSLKVSQDRIRHYEELVSLNNSIVIEH